ncbi:HAD family phosphatase [Paenarthrobacter aurescens]|nr:HAD family phosphatase [Paenarthrobacter aurescens]MDO6143617.1 HAD family phosphatase [Paenarthrobacter aurescens]MDO6147465.1 HAD family phosphatase [Paenarthrobacter aurescens]MDO6158709.1 HAD family phosphatase [Paenarthrobacter aurescens]MDO6162692.1 HAD family phosphatase [Paenarthrobacter aurescens]
MHGISHRSVSAIRPQRNRRTAARQVPRRLETMHSSPGQPLLKAVLWDMDGTLVDTEPYWIAAERALVESHGGTWTHQQAMQLVGQSLLHSAAVLQAAGVQLEAREIVDTLSAEVIHQVRKEVPWRPGARELLDDLHEAGIRCALVTMSEGPLAGVVVESLPKPYFEFMVTGDSVTNGKPHPEAYLTAVERLRLDDPTVSIHHCVALEDSIPGATAAIASGVVTVGIPHQVPLPEDPRMIMWPTLQGRTAPDLQKLVAERFAATNLLEGAN